MSDEAWMRLLGADPCPWLLASDEPAARWIALVELLDRPATDPDVTAAHRDVLADPRTIALIDRLPDWEHPGAIGGHNSPAFAPNLLWLLADMGIGAGDDPRIERLLDGMLEHVDANGRFMAAGMTRTGDTAWGSLLCDAHAIVEALVRFGRLGDARVLTALARVTADLAPTSQGLAWPCIPSNGFRGPGRKGDACPMVTLEALRTFARVPADLRPPQVLDAARSALGIWAARGEAKPYVFGHGFQFKTVKWPNTWYDVLMVLDALGRYPALWRGPDADPADRRLLAELVACLVAYNVGPDGTVIPGSCYRGFEAWSFGQKHVASPFATARVAAVLRRLDDLADEALAIDVGSLASSKGGSGTARPPRGRTPGSGPGALAAGPGA